MKGTGTTLSIYAKKKKKRRKKKKKKKKKKSLLAQRATGSDTV